MKFASRRRRHALLTLALASGAALAVHAYGLGLHDLSFGTGWALLALTLLLAAYNARKKLTSVPLGSSSSWLQFHAYVGAFSLVLFGLHVGGRIPSGPLEAALALLFVGTALSGVVGLALTRIFPHFLTERGGEVVYEQIPMLRRKLREEAEALVLSSVAETKQTTLADHYAAHLASFFSGPRFFWHHLVKSDWPYQRLSAGLAAIDRYLSAPEKEFAERLGEFLRAKNDLDFHHALQSTLKGWLFVHIPLTCALLIFVLPHVLVVHAFHAGVR